MRERGNLDEVSLNVLEFLRGTKRREKKRVDINCLNDILLVVIFLANYRNISSSREASMIISDARTRLKGIVNVATTSMKEDER